MRCRSQDPKRDPASILADREPPIEVATYDDARLGIAGALSIGEELEVLRAERDGVVIGDGALMGDAADVVEIEGRREGSVGGPRLGGGARKARIVAWEEGLQDGIGLLQSTRPRETELTDKPILEGAPEPLDATLGLRGVSGDPRDAQLAQGAADLGEWARVAAELLVDGEGPGAGVIGDDAVPIAVEGDGDPAGADRLAEHDEVAGGIFLRPEDRRGDLVGRIVDRALEDETGPAPFEPVVVAAIPLEEQAGLGHAVAASAEAAPPARPGAGQTGSQQDAVDRRAREDDPVSLREFLGEVLVIEPGIGRARQPHDAALEGFGDAIGSGTAAVPMGQGGWAVPPERREQAPAVPERDAQERRCSRRPHMPFPYRRQHDHSLLLCLRQGNRLPGHAPRVTGSLFIHSRKALKLPHEGPRAILSPSRARRGEVPRGSPRQGALRSGWTQRPTLFYGNAGPKTGTSKRGLDKAALNG